VNDQATTPETESGGGTYFETDSYHEVNTLLKDKRIGSPPAPSLLLRVLRVIGLRSLANAVEHGFMVLHNPPSHTRLRKVVEPFFVRRAVDAMEPEILRVVTKLLDSVADKPEFDLVDEVAMRLPTLVVSGIFGFAEDDADWLNKTATNLAPLGDQELHRRHVIPGARSFLQFRRRVLELVKDRHKNPRADFLTALAEAHYAPGGMTEDEIVGTAAMVFTAGHTTTAYLITSCILMLAENPEVMVRVRANPEDIDKVVEEVLRLHSPIQRVARMALDDIEMPDRVIRKGTVMRLSIAGANRDSDRYGNAGEMDLDRPTTHHLAFAAGAHFCFGLHLARLETRIILNEMIDRFPNLSVPPQDIRWRHGTKFHGLDHLKVRIREDS
jgi:cytochrome P450